MKLTPKLIFERFIGMDCEMYLIQLKGKEFYGAVDDKYWSSEEHVLEDGSTITEEDIGEEFNKAFDVLKEKAEELLYNLAQFTIEKVSFIEFIEDVCYPEISIEFRKEVLNMIEKFNSFTVEEKENFNNLLFAKEKINRELAYTLVGLKTKYSENKV